MNLHLDSCRRFTGHVQLPEEISHLAWEHLGVPQEELESVAGERDNLLVFQAGSVCSMSEGLKVPQLDRKGCGHISLVARKVTKGVYPTTPCMTERLVSEENLTRRIYIFTLVMELCSLSTTAQTYFTWLYHSCLLMAKVCLAKPFFSF